MRIYTNFNADWRFIQSEGTLEQILPLSGQVVTLPHTWNAFDGQDGGGDFARGAFWYVKTFLHHAAPQRCTFLEFQAVSLIADVYLNGTHVYRHQGGFSAFRVDLTDWLHEGENTLAVCADNRENEITYPQNADFTFFGGIYRDVSLIETDLAHFDLSYHGAPGFNVTSVLTPEGDARITLNAYPVNAKDCTVRYTLCDQAGRVVSMLPASPTQPEVSFLLDAPHLWDGIDDPYLYTAYATLLRDGIIADEVSLRFGIRTYAIDPQKGFMLNGRPYPLHGVSRHQDRLDMGWAISRREHAEDIALIKEVGANSIRLAHYQHAAAFYDLCDENGLIVWAEIPFISVFMETPEAREDTLCQMRELIVQNIHHPAICLWGISNEITIGSEESSALLDNLHALNALCKQLDPTRLTTIAHLSMVDNDSPLHKITDVIAYNHYFGWYVGDVEQNAEWLDSFHAAQPNLCLAISEYGAEGITRWHSDTPRVRDYSEEYQAYYHERMLDIFSTRPYLWATYVWNMFDFAADNRDEGGVKGRNNKGLVSYDRKTRKDSFYIYQAHWCKTPMLHLCGRRYAQRHLERITVRAYSNCAAVTLYVNGKPVQTKRADHVFIFENVPLQMGDNTLTAISGALRDEITLTRVPEQNMDYILPDSGAGSNVTNWFDQDGNAVELSFPAGFYSIKNSIKECEHSAQAKEITDAFMQRMSSSMPGRKMPKGMLRMLQGMPLQNLLSMAGKNLPQGVAAELNAQLTQIPLVDSADR